MSHFKGPDPLTALKDFRPDTSVLKLFVEKLRNNGDAIAMIEGQTGKTVTSKELLRNVTSISGGLRRKGVGCGDYVIFCCDKSIASFSALMGVMLTGATSILYPIPLVDIVPKLTGGFPIKAVFCDPHYLDPLKTSLRQLSPKPSLVVTTSPTDVIFDSLIKTEGGLEVYKVQDVHKHIPFIYFSGGTTGDPKGIQVNDIYIQLCGHCFDFGIKTIFLSTPIFWISVMMTLMSSTFKQFAVVWSNSNEPKDNLRLMEKYKIEGWIAGTGTLPRYITESTLNGLFDLSSLKIVTAGGEYLLSSTYKKFNDIVLKDRVKVLNGYGSTEGGLMALLPQHLPDGFTVGMCGPLHAGVEIKILDKDYNLVPVGSLGEVYLKSKALTPGYWGRPDLTSQAFDSEGFLKTGDAGKFDHKGFLHLRGRTMDLIEFRGKQISPAEVEDVLMSHPAVLDAAVVGKPHPTDTQHMTAYVVKKPGVVMDEVELTAFVDDKVEDDLQLRGGVHFLDVLPRTIIGKVKRKELKEL